MTAIAEILKSSPTHVTKTCRECGTTWTCEDGPLMRFVSVCPECSEREDGKRVAAEADNRRLRAWEEICPSDFRKTDPAKLPLPKLLNRVLHWQYGPRGLVLHGNTGKGKSRCAWLLLRREHDAGRRVRAVDHSIGFKYAESFAQSAAAAATWIDRLVSADILFLDDVFKSRLTDSLEQALFTVISSRSERGKPIIITCNDTGATLIERMSQDRGAALVRRIMEYNERIPFV